MLAQNSPIVLSGSVTQGKAQATLQGNLLPGCSGARVSAVGKITSTDAKEWIVPAESNFIAAAKATDLYNDCSGVRLANIQALDKEKVPIVEVDADGEIITGYLFADNYFELYVNNKLIAVDPVPYTPFNSCVVRFKVKRPYTLAVKLIDWEENLGLGTENNQGNAYYAGDGGFIASFSDGTVTDASWKAQTYYIAPLANLASIEELPDGTRSTAKANVQPTCSTACYAVHYPIPDTWNAPSFDDSAFPSAVLYSEATVGVNNKAAYTNFVQQFSGAGASFIWTSNLVLDNVVLARKTVGTITSAGEEEQSTTIPTHISATPNPVRDVVHISYVLPSAGIVRVDVQDLVGNVIATLQHGSADAGTTTFDWHIHTQREYDIPAGIYFLRLQYEGMIQMQALCILR